MKEKTEQLEVHVNVLGQPMTFNEENPFLSPIEIGPHAKTMLEQLFKKQINLDFAGFIQELGNSCAPNAYLWNKLSDIEFDIFDYVKLEGEESTFLFIITKNKGLFPISDIFGLDFNPESTKLIHVIRQYHKKIAKDDEILYFLGVGQYNGKEGIHFMVNPAHDELITKFKKMEGESINLPTVRSAFTCSYQKSLIMLVSNVLKADDLHVFNCKDVISTNDEDIVHPKDKKDDDTDDAIPRDVGFPFDEEGTEELIEFEGDEDFNEILESANSGDETDDSDKHNG